MDLYVVRHCRAEGQAPDAPLTAEGYEQAEALTDFLLAFPIGRIVASPFVRARESIMPFARRAGLEVEADGRLVERVLTAAPVPDWMERLRASFDDLDLELPGGESSRAAMARAVTAADDACRVDAAAVAVVTQGNLMALLLKHFDDRFGFEDWRRLSNPDVFRVALHCGEAGVERVWTPPA